MKKRTLTILSIISLFIFFSSGLFNLFIAFIISSLISVFVLIINIYNIITKKEYSLISMAILISLILLMAFWLFISPMLMRPYPHPCHGTERQFEVSESNFTRFENNQIYVQIRRWGSELVLYDLLIAVSNGSNMLTFNVVNNTKDGEGVWYNNRPVTINDLPGLNEERVYMINSSSFSSPSTVYVAPIMETKSKSKEKIICEQSKSINLKITTN
jgi:hypothetical protein